MTPLLGIYQDDWRPVSLGGATIGYPTNVKNNVTVTARERLNLNGAFEARPNDEPTSEFQSGNRRQNTEYEYTGRTLLLSVSARVGR